MRVDIKEVGVGGKKRSGMTNKMRVLKAIRENTKMESPATMEVLTTREIMEKTGIRQEQQVNSKCYQLAREGFIIWLKLRNNHNAWLAWDNVKPTSENLEFLKSVGVEVSKEFEEKVKKNSKKDSDKQN